ncbi:MAG: thiamine phosphate synthase [Arcticibacter sp.]
MYSKLQYISQGQSKDEQVLNIRKVLDHGCTWIQLRFKNEALREVSLLAEEIRLLTSGYGATLIINDHVQIAKDVDADGVHLGLQDTDVFQARLVLGNKIIGGTANTIQHIRQRIKETCNYIGLGPFRYTSTKEKLSPILGLAGYQSILGQLTEMERKTPVYAIGGIQLEDISEILNTGIQGVAISSALTDSRQQSSIIKHLLSTPNEKVNHSGPGI